MTRQSDSSTCSGVDQAGDPKKIGGPKKSGVPFLKNRGSQKIGGPIFIAFLLVFLAGCAKEEISEDSHVILLKASMFVPESHEVALIHGFHGNMRFCQQLVQLLGEDFGCAYKDLYKKGK